MFFLTGLITLVLLMWKWMGLISRKNYPLRCWGWLSLLNWIGPLKLSLLSKLTPRKLEPWMVLWISSPGVALYFYKSTKCLFMEYCCHIRTGAPSYYLEFLDKLEKQISRSVSPSLTMSLEPLAHCWNVASLSLFYRYYFGRCLSELAKQVPLLFTREVYPLFQ